MLPLPLPWFELSVLVVLLSLRLLPLFESLVATAVELSVATLALLSATMESGPTGTGSANTIPGIPNASTNANANRKLFIYPPMLVHPGRCTRSSFWLQLMTHPILCASPHEPCWKPLRKMFTITFKSTALFTN